jgi:hypothetical protein
MKRHVTPCATNARTYASAASAVRVVDWDSRLVASVAMTDGIIVDFVDL